MRFLLRASSPLRVADIGTNAILLRAERDLATLARRFGTAADKAEIEERIAGMQPAIARLWDAGLGLFTGYDQIGDAPIKVGTSAGFLPLFAHAATLGAPGPGHMAATLAAWGKEVRWPVPSTDPRHAAFEPLRYWRGPIWAVVNWMIADGLPFPRRPRRRGCRAHSRGHQGADCRRRAARNISTPKREWSGRGRGLLPGTPRSGSRCRGNDAAGRLRRAPRKAGTMNRPEDFIADPRRPFTGAEYIESLRDGRAVHRRRSRCRT